MRGTGPVEGREVSGPTGGAPPLPKGADAPGPPKDSAQVLQEALESVTKGTTFLIVGIVLFLALTFIGRVVAARALPVSQFGDFNLGVSFTTLLSILILLGLNQALARMLAWEHDPGEQRTLIRWAIGVSSVTSTAGSVAVFVFAPQISAFFHNPSLVPVFELLSVSVGFGAITPVFASIFQGFHDVRPNALFNQIVNPLLFVVFVLLLLYLHLGLTAVVVAYVVADGVAFVGIVAYTIWRLPRLIPSTARGPPRPKPMLWILTVSLWGVASLGFLTGYVDTLILGVFRSATDVGYYSTSITTSRVILLAAQALSYVYLPTSARLSRLNAGDALRSTYLTSTRWMLLLTFPLFLLFVFAPHLTIAALFGRKYEPAALSLQFLAAAAFFSNVAGPVSASLGGLGMARAQLWTSSTAAAANVALSLSLIPVFGIVGATAAWAIARCTYPGLGLVALHRAQGITPFRRVMLVPLGLTLAIGAPVFVLVEYLQLSPWWIVPLFCFGATVYLLAVILSRSFLPGDLAQITVVERFLRRPLPSVRRFVQRRMAVDPFFTADPPASR